MENQDSKDKVVEEDTNEQIVNPVLEQQEVEETNQED